MTASVPLRAPDGPPLMGASTTVTPAAAQACTISLEETLADSTGVNEGL